MSVTAPAARRSLTLPDWRTALKRRVRRPRKPDAWKWFYRAVAAFNVVWAVQSFDEGHVIGGAADVCISILAVYLATNSKRLMVERLMVELPVVRLGLTAAWFAFVAIQQLFHG